MSNVYLAVYLRTTGLEDHALWSPWSTTKALLQLNEGKDGLFNKWHWVDWILYGKKASLEPYFTLCTKINERWVIDLNVKDKTSRRKLRRLLW